MAKENKMPPLEAGLLTAMHALDNQVLRMMQRTPSETESQGVQKWEPFNQKSQQISDFVLNAFACRQVELDSVMVFARAFTDSLSRIIEELGEDGLGKIRSTYCCATIDEMTSSVKAARLALHGISEDEVN